MTTKNKSIDLVVLDKELSEKGKHTLKTTYEKEVTTELNSFLYELDKYQKAKKRKGLASVKNRSAVNGGGAKPYKQKGTGNARRGTNTTPLRRGGGVIFGPEPRSFAYKLDSNVKKYGYQELLKLKLNINWRGHSDTETLVECFRVFGIKETLCIWEMIYLI